MSKLIDLSGQKFNKWLVIERDISKKFRNPQWICECECGRKSSVTGVNLKANISTQCKVCSGNDVKISVQHRYGKWTVQSKSKLPRRWTCLCDCGNRCEVLGYHLVSGASQQCKKCAQTEAVNLESGIINNNWTLIETFKRDGNTKCKCRCKCGRVGTMAVYAFTSGSSRQCKKCANWTGFGDISGSYWTSLIRGAIKRGLKFTVTIEYAWDIFIKQNKKCELSGLDIDFQRNRSKAVKSNQTASLDRIDSTKGYEIGNIQWVHKDINNMKLNHTQEYFIDLCKKIAEKHS